MQKEKTEARQSKRRGKRVTNPQKETKLGEGGSFGREIIPAKKKWEEPIEGSPLKVPEAALSSGKLQGYHELRGRQ